MSYTVCVTRYIEDVAWLQNLALHVHVMNKGDDHLFGMSSTRLPNKGHEEVGTVSTFACTFLVPFPRIDSLCMF